MAPTPRPLRCLRARPGAQSGVALQGGGARATRLGARPLAQYGLVVRASRSCTRRSNALAFTLTLPYTALQAVRIGGKCVPMMRGELCVPAG